MKGKIEKALVFIISILTAKILAEMVFNWIISYRNNINPYVSTLIGMLIIVLIFTPVITFMNSYLAKMTKSYLKLSKKVSKTSGRGLVYGGLVALVILYYFYLNNWYHIDLLKEAKHWLG